MAANKMHADVRGRLPAVIDSAGWALSVVLLQLPYYHRTNPPLAASSRIAIAEVLADHERSGGR